MSLMHNVFRSEEIKIKRIYESNALQDFKKVPVPSEKIRSVYGEDLKFPDTPNDRPYIFSSFVSSIDGKLAYADQPSAFFVAAKNKLGGGGTKTDFWILNALRGVCDAAIVGGNSLKTDDDYSMHVMDKEIEDDRVAAGLPRIPLNIIMSLDAKDIPLEHSILKNIEVPCIVSTSPNGLKYIKANYSGELLVADRFKETDESTANPMMEKFLHLKKGVLTVIVTGNEGFPDSKGFMRFLRNSGIRRLLIESPGYGHFLVKQRMMDEFFLNFSGVYIGGGDTMTLGKNDKGFLSENHPHMKMLSMHIYNEYFSYFRYKFKYDL